MTLEVHPPILLMQHYLEGLIEATSKDFVKINSLTNNLNTQRQVKKQEGMITMGMKYLSYTSQFEQYANHGECTEGKIMTCMGLQ